MKLKERVLLLLFLSVSCLFIVKYRLGKKQLTGSYNGEVIDDQVNFGLDGSHLHVKRETYVDGKTIFDKHKNYIKHEITMSQLDKKDNSIENSRALESTKDTGSEVGENGDEMDPWDSWWTMVTKRHVTSPNDDKQVQKILHALAVRKILTAKTFSRGTQLKALLKLDGPSEQKVIFKPMR